jgi:hypothetical protein
MNRKIIEKSIFVFWLSSFLLFLMMGVCRAAQTSPEKVKDNKGYKLIHEFEKYDSLQEKVKFDGTVYDWMYGKWKVAYEDKKLGTVSGTATVTGGHDGVSVILKHPKSGKSYYLKSWLVRVFPEIKGPPETVKIELRGMSPPSGDDGTGSHLMSKDIQNAKRLTIAPKSKLTIRIDDTPEKEGVVSLKAKKTAEIVDGHPLTLEFKVDSKKGMNSLTGSWVYSGPESQIPNNRAGTSEFPYIKGKESWSRLPFTLETVTTSYAFKPFEKGRETNVWVLFKGENLPVQPKQKVAIKFKDPKVTFTGRYRTDPRDQTWLKAEVKLTKDGLTMEPKPVTLNGVNGLWDMGLPKVDPKDLRFVRNFEKGKFLPVKRLYQGEIFYVEAEFSHDIFVGQISYSIIPKKKRDGKPIKFLLRKVQSNRNIMRSEPILLWQPDDLPEKSALLPRGKNGVATDVKHIVPAQDSSVLTVAAVHDLEKMLIKTAKKKKGKIKVARANVKKLRSWPWLSALKRAKECKGKYPESYVIKNRYIPNVADFGKSRVIKVTVEDNAAMLILNDELKRVLSLNRQRLEKTKPSYLKEGWTETMLQMAKDKKDHPLLAIGVERAKVYKSRKALKSISKDIHVVTAETVPLQIALFTGSADFDDEEEFKRFARQAIIEAEVKLRKGAKVAAARSISADDCNIDELFRLVGTNIKPIVDMVMPKLVRPPLGDEPRIPTVVPDLVAQRHVKSLYVLGEAVKAQKIYSDLDTTVLLTASTAIVMSGSILLNANKFGFANLTGKYVQHSLGTVLALDALNAASIVDLVNTYDDYEKLKNDRTFAEGAVEILGPERLKKIQKEIDSKETALVMGGATSGLGLISVPKNVGRLAGKIKSSIKPPKTSSAINNTDLGSDVIAPTGKVAGKGMPTAKEPTLTGWNREFTGKNTSTGTKTERIPDSLPPTVKEPSLKNPQTGLDPESTVTYVPGSKLQPGKKSQAQPWETQEFSKVTPGSKSKGAGWETQEFGADSFRSAKTERIPDSLPPTVKEPSFKNPQTGLDPESTVTSVPGSKLQPGKKSQAQPWETQEFSTVTPGSKSKGASWETQEFGADSFRSVKTERIPDSLPSTVKEKLSTGHETLDINSSKLPGKPTQLNTKETFRSTKTERISDSLSTPTPQGQKPTGWKTGEFETGSASTIKEPTLNNPKMDIDPESTVTYTPGSNKPIKSGSNNTSQAKTWDMEPLGKNASKGTKTEAMPNSSVSTLKETQARVNLVSDRLRKMGMNQKTADSNANSKVNSWQLSNDEAIVAAAFDGNIPVKTLMGKTGIAPNDIATHLDKYARLRGLTDANERAMVIARYLGSNTPKNIFKKAFDTLKHGN